MPLISFDSYVFSRQIFQKGDFVLIGGEGKCRRQNQRQQLSHNQVTFLSNSKAWQLSSQLLRGHHHLSIELEKILTSLKIRYIRLFFAERAFNSFVLNIMGRCSS